MLKPTSTLLAGKIADKDLPRQLRPARVRQSIQAIRDTHTLSQENLKSDLSLTQVANRLEVLTRENEAGNLNPEEFQQKVQDVSTNISQKSISANLAGSALPVETQPFTERYDDLVGITNARKKFYEKLSGLIAGAADTGKGPGLDVEATEVINEG